MLKERPPWKELAQLALLALRGDRSCRARCAPTHPLHLRRAERGGREREGRVFLHVAPASGGESTQESRLCPAVPFFVYRTPCE